METGQVRQLQNIIKQHPVLMWDTGAYDTLDAEAIAEAIYNYGSWENVTEYHRLLGTEAAELLFKRLTNKKRCNIHPKVRYFFMHYYGRHVS
jgi:hypothetical protein